MERIIYFLLMFSLSATARPLRDFLFEESAKGKLALPQLDDSIEAREEALTPKIQKSLPFFSLYAKNEKAKLVKSWISVELPVNFQMPQGRPTARFYNTHLIWGLDKDGKKIIGFRPVDTNTGCKSGCTPVVFHLELNPEGLVTDILEEAQMPLRKIWHEKFSPADKAKALHLAQEFPAALKDIENPELTTNAENIFPAQTWTAFQNILVPGAAYTSYRIYEASLKTHDFLQASREKLTEVAQEQGRILNQVLRSDGEEEVTVRIKEFKALLQNEKTTPAVRQLVFSLGPRLLLWMSESDFKADKVSQSFFELPEFKNSRRQTFCAFRRDLIYNSQGQKLLIDMKRHPSRWPLCDGASTQIFPLLAAGLLKDKDRVKSYFKELGTFQIPEILKSEAFLLSAYLQSLALMDNRNDLLKVAAELKVRFPQFSYDPQLTESEALTFKSFEKDTELSYREEIRRSFQADREKFPLIKGQQNYGKRKIQLPLKGGEKLYVFFGSWCPHCQHTLQTWVKRQLPPAVWDKITLVEIFRNRSNADTQGFCELTGIAKDRCQKIIYIPDSSEAPEFYRRLALASIPRMIFVDSAQRIGIFDFVFQDSEGKDLGRDLQWTFEELERKSF